MRRGPTVLRARSDRSRAGPGTRDTRAHRRWAILGAMVGALVALIAFAPASWLARAVAAATDQQVLLVASRGTVWSGEALLVFTGGAGSRDATVLPSPLHWRLRPAGWSGVQLELRQDCCLNGTLALRLDPGIGRLGVELPGGRDWLAQWPSDVLRGLGTPFNTLQLGGSVRLASPGLRMELVQGRWRLLGSASVELLHASSRLTTLDTLGSYRLQLQGKPEGGPATLTLQTLDGALRLSGEGTWSPQGVRFRGEARAAEAQQPVLNNLLNIIGRRDGDRSVISIG
ncbi:type II secretion system protein N [Caldimonas tepidiphila]|uniref:type II secretion system protein N n=1 Tax=Caldimonas tepidiphila TaxID=2315841 RepID=UPI001F0C88EC|nr:type II secretion system protein N [Caldimonas tepidiphila]